MNALPQVNIVLPIAFVLGIATVSVCIQIAMSVQTSRFQKSSMTTGVLCHGQRCILFVGSASILVVHCHDILCPTTMHDIDIFCADFIFVPIHGDLHWTVAVICFPAAVGACNTRSACILHLDSLRSVTHSADGTNLPAAVVHVPLMCCTVLDSTLPA